MSEKQISVEELKVGMYLTGMDKPWWETPFLMHKFLLKTDVEIQKIVDCDVREVTIDVSKGADVVKASVRVESQVAVLDDPDEDEAFRIDDVIPDIEPEPEPDPEPEIEFSYEDIVVLITDDDPNGRQILTKRLKKVFGCVVLEAEHGGKAIPLLHEQSPDILVLDLMMPVKDGRSVFTYIQTNDELIGIPVVIHSAQNTADAILPVLHKKPIGYLVKPVELEELKEKLQPAFDAAVARRRGTPLFKPYRIKCEGMAAIIKLYDFDVRSSNQLIVQLDPIVKGGVTQLIFDLSCFETNETTGGQQGIRSLFRDLRERSLTIGVCGMSETHSFAKIVRIFGGQILDVTLADLLAR